MEVFLVFLRLGVTSFGGPVAHLGYFREAFVERRRWLTDRAYADLVALTGNGAVGLVDALYRAGSLVFAGAAIALVAIVL